MNASVRPQQRRWKYIALPLLFICLGLPFLPLAGIQDDEALFALPIFHVPSSTVFDARLYHLELPLMQRSYLGSLKSWMWFGILTRIPPSYVTIRLPALLIGALSVWIFVWILDRAHGPLIAWLGGLLLATDTVYLLTSSYDWGPVALQHLLSVAGIALVLHFALSGKRAPLFWGFFLFGLALWDKALFFWLFTGIAIATIVVFRREVQSRCTKENFIVAIGGLLLGALPLVAYNIASDFETLRSNSSFSLAEFPAKLHALRIAWDGQILFDYMVHAPWAPGAPRQPESALGGISAPVHSLAGFRYHYFNALLPAILLALLLAIPLLFTRARKPILFCLIAFAIAWLQMAVTRNAGLGAHHIVLLWPIPHWFLAVVFVEAAEWRPLQPYQAGAILLASLMLFLIADNLLLTNEYFYQLAFFGANRNWNDAIFRLSDDAARIEANHLVVDDWGILNPLIALNRNRLPLAFADQSFLDPAISEADRERDLARLAQDVWIGHTPEYQLWTGEDEHIGALARSAGYQKRMLEIVPDRNGHPVFEIFRFVRIGEEAGSN
jgi:hypothetical protein